jgi:hypothetical protein
MSRGDEFEDAATSSQWQRVYQQEGWQADPLEAWELDGPHAPGHMLLMPYTSSWFEDLRGVLVFKSVTGDFVCTTHLIVYSRHGTADPLASPNPDAPQRDFSLAGILCRAPRSVVQGAPVPYTTNAVWPPAAHGSDWTPGGENYLFLSFGTGGNPGTRQYEVKTTSNSVSTLYYRDRGVPDSGEVWLQVARVGATFLVLRRHPGGPWVVENRYTRPDLPQALQVGITTYTDWPNLQADFWSAGAPGAFHHNYIQVRDPWPHEPDLVAHVDYVRFQRPHTDLTEFLLAGVPVDFDAGGASTSVVELARLDASAAAPYLGDAAHIPLGTLTVSSSGGEASGIVTIRVERVGESLVHPLALAYATAPGTAGAPGDFGAATGALVWATNDASALVLAVDVVRDGVAEGGESFHLVLSDLTGPATFPGGASIHTTVVAVADHPVDQWRADSFGDQANEAIGQVDADFDGDGAANLAEFAFGTDAQQSTSRPGLRMERGADGPEVVFEPEPAALPWLHWAGEAAPAPGETGWTGLASRAAGAGAWSVAEAGASVEETGATVRIRPSTEASSRAARARIAIAE